MKAPRGQLEQRLLVLLTLALVAFGLVMVFSATSAAAALGKGDPITSLRRQGVYALIGIALLVAASRFDHRRLRNLAPPLLVTALGLCVVVLVVAPQINGARRWLTAGPLTFQPSELAKLALLIWAAASLAVDLGYASVPFLLAMTLDRAVAEAASAARPGDVVLLSPACASYDQFRDYDHRGEEFRRLVQNLEG